MLHRENIGQMFRSFLEPGFEASAKNAPALRDDIVTYYGQ